MSTLSQGRETNKPGRRRHPKQSHTSHSYTSLSSSIGNSPEAARHAAKDNPKANGQPAKGSRRSSTTLETGVFSIIGLRMQMEDRHYIDLNYTEQLQLADPQFPSLAYVCAAGVVLVCLCSSVPF